MNITQNVTLKDCWYLIRIDGEELCFTRTESVASSIISSIADAEQKRLRNDKTKVTVQNDGSKVIILTQSIGRFFNGPIVKMVIDYVQVPFAILIS